MALLIAAAAAAAEKCSRRFEERYRPLLQATTTTENDGRHPSWTQTLHGGGLRVRNSSDIVIPVDGIYALFVSSDVVVGEARTRVVARSEDNGVRTVAEQKGGGGGGGILLATAVQLAGNEVLAVLLDAPLAVRLVVYLIDLSPL